MASISITYTSATSYTVSVSGLTVGQKYHIFTEDLNASGSVTGYVCRYSQTASSSSWSNSYSCGSAYSGFTRHVYMYCTGTTATSHSVGSTYSSSQLPTGSTGMWSAYGSWSGGGGTTTSYKITLKVGAGVARISYKINSASSSTTYMLNSSTGSVTRDVGSGGYLYITAVTYEDGYTYPVIATDQTSTPYSSFTVINSSGSFSDHYVSAPSSGGTRIVNISATYAPTYYYRIVAYANGGTFSYSSTTWAVNFSTSDSYVTYYLSNITVPTRSGYTFKGWGSSATSTTVYGSSISFAVSSTSGDNPTVKTVYAVWEKITISLFYWSSAATDATLIAKGQPISNLTAARWNRLMAKIAEVAAAQGGSFGYSAVSSGGTFYASEFNEARTGILGLSGYGTLPAAQSSGNEVKAALLEGSGSLKSALNTAITNFNNS